MTEEETESTTKRVYQVFAQSDDQDDNTVNTLCGRFTDYEEALTEAQRLHDLEGLDTIVTRGDEDDGDEVVLWTCYLGFEE
jgi:hypothetical protein